MNESLDTFFADFGVPVILGAVSSLGIFDQPDSLSDGLVISTFYQLTGKTADFGAAAFGDPISVDGVAYTVREVRKIEDGKMVRLGLEKV